MAEVAEGLRLIEQAIFGGDAEAVFDGGSKLNATEAVEVEIFDEVEVVADSGWSLSGDLSDECEKPVRGCAECCCGVVVVAGAGGL